MGRKVKNLATYIPQLSLDDQALLLLMLRWTRRYRDLELYQLPLARKDKALRALSKYSPPTNGYRLRAILGGRLSTEEKQKVRLFERVKKLPPVRFR